MELSVTSSREPYPGLRSFRKDESDIFFGRDDHLDEMVAKLAEHHFLCITGPSGCGKSSLARTGLMNHLEAGFLRGRGSDWLFCDLRPGDHPLEALFDALAAMIAAEIKPQGDETDADYRAQFRELFSYQIEMQRRTSDLNKVVDPIAAAGNRPMMILVDQFEELFRYAVSDSDRAVSFVEILLHTAAAKSNIYVVITIRTDELEKCSRYPDLTQMINDSQFLTPALDRYQIQEAIEGPIALWGGKISSTFCTWFLNCLEDELDKLPLMQHALKVLYREKCSSEHRQDVTIEVEDFVRVFRLPPGLNLSSPEGRLALRSSLSDRLTQRYNELPDRLKAAAQRMFCALTTVESQGRDIRQPRKLADLARIIGESVDDTRTIVRAFSEGDEAYLRCNPALAEDDTVDVTHECILRLWSLLQTEWLSNERKSADNIVLLAGLAHDWDTSSNGRSAISRLLWPAVLRGYTRQLYQKWFDTARPNSAWAARYLGKINWPALAEPRRRLSPEEIFQRITALLYASKWRRVHVWIASTAVTAAILVGFAFLYDRLLTANLQKAQSELERIGTSGLRPEEHRISDLKAAMQVVRDGFSGYQAIWATLPEIYELYTFHGTDKVQGQIHAADFAADGKSVLAVDLGGTLHQWALAPGRKSLRELLIGPRGNDGLPAQGRSLRVSPSGDVAAVGFSDGSVFLVDLTDPSRNPKPLLLTNGDKPHTTSVFKLAFSTDSSLLVTSSRGGNIVVWQRSPVAAAPGQTPKPDPLQWDPKENIVFQAGHPADIWAVDIDQSKQLLAVGVAGGQVCLLRVERPDQRSCSTASQSQGKTIKAVKFLPGNNTILVSAGNDAKITIWTVDAAALTLKAGAIPLYQDNDIWDLDFSPDGTLLSTASWDGSVRVYQTLTWQLLNTIGSDKVSGEGGTGSLYEDRSISLRTVRFDSSSTMLVTASLDHTARVWTPLLDRTSVLDLSYRLAPQGANSVRAMTSVAVGPAGQQVAFTDIAGVYARSTGQPPKLLGFGGVQPLHFSQVRIPFKDQVVASAIEPTLMQWTRLASGDWTTRAIALPGDTIKADRSIAVDTAGSTLAVVVQQAGNSSILLCPMHKSPKDWTCPATSQRFDVSTKPDGCATSSSQIMITFSKSGRWIAAGAGHCAIEVFDRQSPAAPPHSYSEASWTDESTGPLPILTWIDFSPDEKSVVTTTDSRPEVRVWNLADGTSRNINHHFSPTVTAAKYEPSGQWIVSTSYDNTVVISSATTGDKLVTLRYRNSLLALDVLSTPTGVLMAMGSEAGDVNVMHFFSSAAEIQSYAASEFWIT